MIIAVDFDGTLCEIDYPNIGDAKIDVIQKIKEAKKKGHIIILNTCRVGSTLNSALFWLQVNWGLEFDYVNENCFENISQYFDCRKIGADLYVDDLAPGSIDYFLKLKLEEL